METRPSLHKFQESLAARLREAAGEPVSTSRLGLQSGARNWMLKLEDAGEIVPVPDLMPVPLTKPWFLGLANVRGVLVSVVDLSRFRAASAYRRAAEECLAEMRACPPAPGFERVEIPGEREAQLRCDRLIRGIPVPPATLESLRHLGRRVGVGVEALVPIADRIDGRGAGSLPRA